MGLAIVPSQLQTALAGTPPDDGAQPTSAPSRDRVERARAILDELLREADDASNVLTKYRPKEIFDDLDSALEDIADSQDLSDEQMETEIAHVWRSYVRERANPPTAHLAFEDEFPPPTMVTGLDTAEPQRGPASTMAPIHAEPDGTSAPSSSTRGFELDSSASVEARPDATASHERVVALVASISELSEANQARLLPMLNAVLKAETSRYDNWAGWDSYRVGQWQSVFQQSQKFSWWVFVVAHIVLGLALTMSFWEFVRAGLIAREKDKDQRARRVERRAMIERLASYAPEAQVAGVNGVMTTVQEQSKQETELEISANKLVMRTSIMGFVMMAFALAFYALFIIYVYPISK